MPAAKLVYWLDTENRISSINGPWDSFALRNNGEKACTAHVLGQSIEKFITGDETRMHLLVLLSAVRTLGKVQKKEYRCDSPLERRFMEMVISKESNGLIKIEHSLLKLEPKQSNLVICSESSPKPETTLRCSMCNRLEVKGKWWEETDAIANTLFEPLSQVFVAYTVCSDCQK